MVPRDLAKSRWTKLGVAPELSQLLYFHFHNEFITGLNPTSIDLNDCFSPEIILSLISVESCWLRNCCLKTNVIFYFYTKRLPSDFNSSFVFWFLPEDCLFFKCFCGVCLNLKKSHLIDRTQTVYIMNNEENISQRPNNGMRSSSGFYSGTTYLIMYVNDFLGGFDGNLAYQYADDTSGLLRRCSQASTMIADWWRVTLRIWT